MNYAENVLDLIGRTPLVKLNSVARDVAPTVLVKLEYLNPGGSIKDRIALKMIEEAEAEGKLAPGGTVVEPTSGNTGVGLAMVAQQKGYRSVFITPDKVGQEKRDVLKAYGAEVVVTKTSVSPDSPDSYYGVANRLEADIEGAYQPNQFFNPAAPQSHFESTGPEIWNDTDGTITHLVVGAGTGGTVTGTGRYLKEISADRDSGPVRVVVADPDGSIYSGGEGRPYFVEGVGEDMWPGNYDPAVPDEIHAVNDAESFAMTRRLAAEEGLLVGGSSGMAVVAGLRAAQELGPDDVMVIILPDSGRGYLGKIFSDTWMDAQGFVVEHAETPVPDTLGTAYRDGGESDPRSNQSGAGAAGASAAALLDDVAELRIGELIAEKGTWLPDSLPSVVAAVKTTTVAEALSTMNRYGIDAMPVVSQMRDDLRVGEVLGAVSSAGLAELVLHGTARPRDEVLEHASAALPQVSVHATVDSVYPVLRSAGAVMVARDGVIEGILTVHDLLGRLGD
ncbi:MAG: pyridoxal-phosphate dependent enzyme [Micrococcaceae bacterium]